MCEVNVKCYPVLIKIRCKGNERRENGWDILFRHGDGQRGLSQSFWDDFVTLPT
nr:MAG TPA: hypothetical protein [Caudoviricetes sp.]